MPFLRYMVLLLPFVVTSRLLAAQERPWHVSLLAVPTTFGQGASSDAPAPGEIPAFAVGPSLRGSLEISRRFGRWEVALAGGYGKHGLRGEGESSSITIEPAYTLVTATLAAAYAIVSWGTEARLQAFLGPNLQFWSGDAVIGSQTKLGALGGLQVTAPIAGACALDARAAIGVAPSPITDEELSEFETAYEAGAMWSRQFGVGLRIAF